MKTRNLHKIVTFLIACLILACCLVARASAQELSTEQCGAWIEKLWMALPIWIGRK